MQIAYKRIGVFVGFSILLALLVVNATVTRRQLGLQIGAESWVAHTQHVLFEVNQLEFLLVDAETGQRGNLYTGDSKYLAPYHAAIAHEINNPLQAVASLVYLSRTMSGAPETVVRQLTPAERELQRVAHIAQQTLETYKGSRGTESVDLAVLVESVQALHSNKLKSKDIRIERDFGDRPWLQAAPGELKQVISNLVASAADAVHNHGTIAITLGNMGEAGQTMFHILVEDDGPGIPLGFRPRLFEPFFTTKRDVGTRLGLRLTKEIVERHGGRIEVIEQTDGEPGAAFSVLLPISPHPPGVTPSSGEVSAFQPSGPDGRMENEDHRQEGE
ncbi:MAG: HAMP domain-containing sensor histidine kinase [Terracidiphilus sp.]